LRDQHDWRWLEDGVNGGEVLETETLGIFLSSAANRVPQAAVSQVQNLQSIPHRIIVATVVTENVPFAQKPSEVQKINHRATQVIIYSGFMETPNVPKALRDALLSPEDETAATYYLSDRNFVNPESGEMKGNSDKVFAFLHKNSETASQYFGLPENRVITLAVQMDL
jgi:KUP system potassium uptake protein